jgi:MFS family permease
MKLGRHRFSFLLQEWQILAFGISFHFFSSFGRTFYIAIFGGEIRSTFDLTPGEFSYIYSAATLTGVLFIPWLGKRIDEVDLRSYSISMVVILGFASFLISVAPNLIILFAALFGLRVTGGAMMNHTVVVTIARYFNKRRGVATSICSLGVPIAEAVLPILAVLSIALMGWRMTWMVSGVLLCVIISPVVFWILGVLRPDSIDSGDQANVPKQNSAPSATCREVLRDIQFYRLAPVLILPTPLVTALFFHHATIAEIKEWSLEWLATCFVAYAGATVVASISVGPLVDRHSAKTVLPWSVVPMAIGLIFLAYGTSAAGAFIYLMCFGLTAGARYTLTAVIWAEIYGTRFLGSIRAVVHTVTMLLAGLSPAVLGWLIDQHVPVATIVQIFTILLIISSILAKGIITRS